MKRQVVVYYANETSLDLRRLRTVEARIGRIREHGDATAVAIAARVAADIDVFTRTTYGQVVELQRAVRGHGVEAGLAGAVFFDNETARCGWFEVQEAGGYRSRKEPFREVSGCHRLLEDSPLSAPAALEAALDVVSRLYTPLEHEFVLVTRSHGTDVMAITPALPEPALDLAESEIAGLKHQDPNESGDSELGIYNLGPEGGLGVFYGLGAFYGLGGKGLMLGSPELAREYGVGIIKHTFLDILEDAGTRLGMRFSLVFMDSCGSEIPRELAREVPGNVGGLYGSTREGLSYEAPDYALLGRDIDVGGGIVGAMEQLLGRTANVIRFALEQDGKRLRAI